MYPDWQLVVAILVLGWLGLLSWQVRKDRRFLQNLFPKSGSNFQDKMEEVLREVKGLKEFKRDSCKNLQSLALKRYNPYHDTGGDQSFSVAILDGRGDGVVISSLHSRAGTRIFAKPIRAGGEDSAQLSGEEQQVVVQAYSSLTEKV